VVRLDVDSSIDLEPHSNSGLLIVPIVPKLAVWVHAAVNAKKKHKPGTACL
jgi:hypothetical protein